MVEINTFWSFLVVLGFLGWVTAGFLFFFQAFDEEDHFYPRKALLWGAVCIACYAIWAVGLYNA